jgi:hypothetical protein
MDCRAISPGKFSNEGRLFIFYTVMGYNFDQDDSYDYKFYEMKGTITIVEYTSPGVLGRKE